MDTLKPDDILKDYKIIRILGKGSMGQVYLAKDRIGNSFYAIKETLSSQSGEEKAFAFGAFKREADLLKKIRHPGLPSFCNFFNYKDKKYLVMEYIEGEPLENMISESEEPFSEKDIVFWGIQLCEILFYIHNLSPEPVIYRDLKPANLILIEGGIVRTIDFGVARRYDPNKDSDTIRLGTPGYAAPEQCRKKGQSTPRSDIYALGVVLHQLLTLYDPTATPFKLPPIRKLNPQVSEQLEWIVNKAINLDPRDRYLDAGLFRDELTDYYEENFGSFYSPYKKQLPYTKDRDPLIVPVKEANTLLARLAKSLRR